MKNIKNKITLFLFVVSCYHSLAQDSILQCDFTISPVRLQNKFSYWNSNPTKTISSINKVPSINFSLPISKKLHFSAGFNFYQSSYELFFNDSSEHFDNLLIPQLYPTLTFLYHTKSTGFGISLPLFLDYTYFYNQNVTSYFSGGVEYSLWKYSVTFYEFYPLQDNRKEYYSNNGFNSLLDETNYNLNLSTTLKYFPLKHFGILIRPLVSYNLEFNEYSLQFRINTGICYR